MELSQAFKFLAILAESIKLIYKNPKPIFQIIAISVITPSIFILLISYSILFLTNDSLINLWAILLAEVVFFVIFYLLFMFIRVSTILVSATSYTGKTISLTELFPIFKSTFKMQRKTISYTSRQTIPFAIVMVILVPIVVLNPNITTISIAVLIGVPGSVYQIYLSIVWAVAAVVSVVEQDCYAEDALDRANVLVEGQKLHGFLMILFLNLVALLGFAGYWMAIDDIAEVNITIFVLVMVNVLSLFQILVLVATTVFYFDCKKQRGEEIESVGLNVKYSRLPTAQLGNDLP